MDAKRWSILQETFDSFADMQPEEKAQALRALSETDPGMATEVGELLEEDASARPLLDVNIESLLHEALQYGDTSSVVDSRIGPYRILRLLGEGGMGVVYLAERTDIGGCVAIKLLRDAWLSPIRRERFAMEQQMLGLLRHPSIARIYDAGTTKEGTPWFVMEFSDGVPISEYFAGRDSTGREIVRLVGAVCETVRYAHSLAIIHRDLKPSNILVTEDGQIKLLDFGIAKQMDLVNRGSTVTTAGFRLFTPAYAAPELQSENKVGVFTDIYSMGVILYQLITRKMPFPEGGLGERTPQRPSKVQASAGIESRLALSKSEWGDIDAICAKALNKEAENRYGSMDALIADIDAFLDDRPLAARRNAVLYTSRKFLYRNRLSVLSVTVGLLIVIAGTLLFTVRLAKARDAAARARDQAVTEAARSARVQRFTESLFTGGANYDYPPPGIKVTQMLDRGRSEALQITGDSQLQAAMLQSVGTAYLSLARYADAEPLLKKAQPVICAANKSLQCADVEDALAETLFEANTGAEIVNLSKDALQIKRQNLTANDPSLANGMVDVGLAYAEAGDPQQAKNFFGEAVTTASAYRHPTRELAFALDQFAMFGFPYNDPRAMEYARRSEQINKQLFGEHSFEYARSEAYVGEVLYNYGRYEEAERFDRAALAVVQAWSGPEEPITVRYILNLARVLAQEKKLDEAKKLLTHALEVTTKSDLPSTLEESDEYFHLGFTEFQQADLDAAERHYAAAVSLADQHLTVNQQLVDLSELGLGTIYDMHGEYTRAESTIRLVLTTTNYAKSYVGVAGSALLGHVLLHERRFAESEVAIQPAYTWFTHDSTMRPHTAMAYTDLAEDEKHLGRPLEAAKILAELRAHPK
jgi:eukaryotic-like serine/threonine-protein kinase